MSNENYIEYLHSDRWKEIAKKRMEIDRYCCQSCGCRGSMVNPLEVHHLTYRSIYHEKDRVFEDLVTLCHACHKQIHSVMNRITSEDGRRGWKNEQIPQVHICDLQGGRMEDWQVIET